MKRILIGLTIVLLSTTFVMAQDDNSGAIPSVPEQLEQIERNTETLRELDPLTDVPILFPSREETYDYLVGEFETFYTDEIINEVMTFYIAFEFLPPDFDFVQSILELYGQQVAGFYDPEVETMNVVTNTGQAPEGRILILDRITYSHEYVHALQDQHFDLTAYQEAIAEDPSADSNFAYQALIEGDATFIMNEYTQQVTEANPLAAMVEMGIGVAQAGNIFLPAGTPAIFEAELLFPYLEGEKFVRALYIDGGWDRVNSAYDNLPQSTEHILHPDRYLAGDMPQTVELAINAPDGWEHVQSGTMGEFYLREWLDAHLLLNAPIDTAATGWGGDAYHIYHNADGESAWELRIVWDTAADADEFGVVIQEFAESRLPEANSTMGDIICWSGAVALCVTYVDAITIDVTFAPSAEIAGELLN